MTPPMPAVRLPLMCGASTARPCFCRSSRDSKTVVCSGYRSPQEQEWLEMNFEQLHFAYRYVAAYSLALFRSWIVLRIGMFAEALEVC